MQAKHWIGIVIIFVVGYFVGAKFPAMSSKITGSVPSVSM